MGANTHEYADSRAARLLTIALGHKKEQGLSLRQIGKSLGYKQAVVLSHMAHGRTPVPIDRAADIARAVGLDEREFLLAVLQQRYRHVDWGLLSSVQDGLVDELRRIAEGPLDGLPSHQKNVLREAVADPRAGNRWLSIAELGAIELVRELRPHLATEGLNAADRNALRVALTGKLKLGTP